MIALSFGIPLGLGILLVGAILLLAKQNKILAAVVMAVGLCITLATVLLIVLAVNSQM